SILSLYLSAFHFFVVTLQKDMQVTVYSVDGRIVSSQMLSSGRHTVEVPKGIYIVNRTKVAVF
ncbi:DUF6383 domain-containing protein, partial [Barnesiella intestinihominis]|uniref:DUF6383 domain-containing protein n=1 Tax=Barnesiella intestinihominis TaxID=487174 RepID=UPI002FD9782E